MKIARVCHTLEPTPFFAVIQGDMYTPIGDPFAAGQIEPNGKPDRLCDVKLLAPCVPSKIVCVGLNYSDHAGELAFELPEQPLLFLKPPSSVIGPGDSIIYPAAVGQLDYEAELAVVIGKTCKDVAPDDAGTYLLGYTCLNDVTARDLQKRDGQWSRCKGFDTFCPIGPTIETDFDWRDAAIEARVNDQVRQRGRTSQMIFDVPHLVSFISGIMTLCPGDVIATGTPAGIGPMQRGDRVTIAIEGIGTLDNVITG